MRMETQLRLLHRSDFRREVVLALLDAFAALEADVAHDVQRGASRLGGFVHQRGDGLVTILDELLVKQAHFLVVLFDLTRDDAVNDLFGLAGFNRLRALNFGFLRQLVGIHFFSYPYTSERAKEKVLELAQLLTPWCGRLTVHIVPFTEIQEQIRMNCPEDHFTLIMRRFMMRLAQRVADEVRAKALVTGECLGQVASQTMEALRVSEDVAELPVLRPLIGMDKEEIIRISRKIGTFDTSILPYEDCCTVFTPRHPKTKPHVEEVRELEAVLDVDALCDRAMAGREFVRIKF